MSLYGLRTFQIVNIIVLRHNEIQPNFEQFWCQLNKIILEKILTKNYNGWNLKGHPQHLVVKQTMECHMSMQR